MILHREAFGLEITAGSLRLLHAKWSGLGVRVLCAEHVALGDDPGEVVLLLRNLIEQHHLQQVPCVLGMRSDSLLLRVLDIGRSDLRSVAELLEEQLDHYKGVADDQVICEHLLFRKEGGGRCLILAVMREDAAWAALRAPGEANVKVTHAVPHSIAFFNGVSALRGWLKTPFVTAEIGPESTEITIGTGRTLLLNRRIPHGWNSFQGSAHAPLASEEWIREVEACLDFYRADHPSVQFHPKEIYLMRNDRALAPAFIGQVAQSLNIQAHGLDQLSFGRKSKQPVGPFACAYGLALAGLGTARIHLTLLPPRLREKLILRWQLKYWVAASLFAIASCLILLTTMKKGLSRVEQNAQALSAQLEQFEAMEEEYSTLQQANQLLRRQIDPLRTAQLNAQWTLAVLKAVTESKHPDDWITLIADSTSYERMLMRRPGHQQPETDAGKRDTAPELLLPETLRVNRFVVEGYTVSHELATVQTLIEKLRSNPLIVDVDLLADDRVRVDEERDAKWAFAEGKLFAIEVTMIML